VPSLVNTVKGAANFEQETLLAVVNARKQVNQVNVDSAALSDPAAFQQFEKAQGELSSALSRLMVVVERYPDIKANKNFLELQSQLEGTENRIAVARKDYIQSVQLFNTEIRTFPGTIWQSVFYPDLTRKESFSQPDSVQEAPQIQF
jgi:LemA protein